MAHNKSSESDAIRKALRLLEKEESRKKTLSKVLATGEKSGIDKNFDPNTHLAKLHSNLK